MTEYPTTAVTVAIQPTIRPASKTGKDRKSTRTAFLLHSGLLPNVSAVIRMENANAKTTMLCSTENSCRTLASPLITLHDGSEQMLATQHNVKR